MTAAWCYVKAQDRWSREVVVKRAKQGALVTLVVLAVSSTSAATK